METQSSPPASMSPAAARKRLDDARRAHDTAVRQTLAPAWLIVVLSVFCGVLTVPSAYRGPGSVVTIVAVALFVAALIAMSARNRWRPLLSASKPRWGIVEVTLICLAVVAGGAVGPHVLASPSNSGLVSWALGAAVAGIVTGCLFGANASYRRRTSRTWHR